MEIIHSTHQSMTAFIGDSKNKWVLTAIYGNSHPGPRKGLWKTIDAIANIVEDLNLPWSLMGDFNEITNISEKSGGSYNFTNTGFDNCINRNGLIDMGYIGLIFTWISSSRCIFPTKVRNISDHAPILLSTESNQVPSSNRKPFHFFAMWLEHEDFNSFISEVWESSEKDISSKLARITPTIINWNKEVFGSLFVKNKRLLVRLAGIQKSQDLRSNSFLWNLNYDLEMQLKNLLQLEEKFWQQKSRVKWLKEGG